MEEEVSWSDLCHGDPKLSTAALGTKSLTHMSLGYVLDPTIIDSITNSDYVFVFSK